MAANVHKKRTSPDVRIHTSHIRITLAAVRRYIISHKLALLVFEIAADGDHGRVVGGQIQRREEDIAVVTFREVNHGVAQAGIRRHAARQHQILAIALLESFLHLVGQRFNDGMLDRSRQIMDILVNEVGILLEIVAHEIEERGLQSAEAVIQTWQVRNGKLEALRVSLLRVFVNNGTARVWQSEDLRRFIESFARRIINSAAQLNHVEVVVDLQ